MPKAVRFHKQGGPEVLQYEDIPVGDPGPGQAVLYGTTQLFLEKVGLDRLADLPPLGDFVPGAEVVEALEQGLRPEA